jgi:hypothetical protein
MNLKETGYEVVDRTYLAQDSDQWRALMNTKMDPSTPQKMGDFLTG